MTKAINNPSKYGELTVLSSWLIKIPTKAQNARPGSAGRSKVNIGAFLPKVNIDIDSIDNSSYNSPKSVELTNNARGLDTSDLQDQLLVGEYASKSNMFAGEDNIRLEILEAISMPN